MFFIIQKKNFNQLYHLQDLDLEAFKKKLGIFHSVPNTFFQFPERQKIFRKLYLPLSLSFSPLKLNAIFKKDFRKQSGQV